MNLERGRRHHRGRGWRWLALLMPLLCGSLVQVSCGKVVKNSIYAGAFEFISGQVNTGFQVLVPYLSDLLLNLAPQPSGTGG